MYWYWSTVTVVVIICCSGCGSAPTSSVSLVWVRRLPPWPLYMETEICNESVGDGGNRVKASCPLNCVPPFTGERGAFAEPKLMFEVTSYALPVAYSCVKGVVQKAEIGMTSGTLEFPLCVGITGLLSAAVHDPAYTRLLVATDVSIVTETAKSTIT